MGICRNCRGDLTSLVNLGDIYWSNFVKERDDDLPKSPLNLSICSCGLVQLKDMVDLDPIYRHYWYRTSTNETMMDKLQNVVDEAQKWRPLTRGDVVLDIGCNDGSLFQMLPSDVVKIGFDPALNLADISGKKCDYLHTYYFYREGYDALLTKRASIIFSLAMFYDLNDPNDFISDIVHVMDPEGLWVVQMSYTPLMVRQNAFDNICHEHVAYYTLRSFEKMILRYGLQIVDVRLNNVNGGSFLAFIQFKEAIPKGYSFDRDIGAFRKESYLMQELYEGYDSPNPYKDMGKKIDRLCYDTRSLLQDLKAYGKTVIGYGASTKGNTLLQRYGIDENMISAIAERQPGKVGLKTVGSWIPIISEEEMRRRRPAYLFVLPWHFRDNIVKREADFLREGGHMIFPLPKLEVV